MIAWLQPWALWGLGLLALPVAIHLLQRRQASRVPFPSTRFVSPSRTSAIRLRPPSDVILLLLRVTIVALAVLGAAQPLVLGESRTAGWNERTARAIVVDTSASMRAARAGGRSALDDAVSAAGAEAAAEFTLRVDDEDLDEGLRRAAAWLMAAPPARREIVVISDFQHGSLTASAIERIEQEIGLRFVRAEPGGWPSTFDGVPLLDGRDGARKIQRIHLTPDGTRLRVDRGLLSAPRDSSRAAGFRVVGNPDTEQRMLAILSEAGTPAPEPEQPIAILFPPAPAPQEASARFDRWMIATLAGIERNPELSDLAREMDGTPVAPADRWTVLIGDRQSDPLVRAAALNGELLLQVAAPASSYFAAAVGRAALVARYGRVDHREREVLTIPRETLSAWARDPGPVGERAWRNVDASDAPWFWAGAVGLLLLEQVLRARSRIRREDARAAA